MIVFISGILFHNFNILLLVMVLPLEPLIGFFDMEFVLGSGFRVSSCILLVGDSFLFLFSVREQVWPRPLLSFPCSLFLKGGLSNRPSSIIYKRTYDFWVDTVPWPRK